MSGDDLFQLFPASGRRVPLEGLYLAHDLRARSDPRRPFVYGNYVTSLDGRIAVERPEQPGLVVPPNVANPRDWRLFQELAVQADVLLTSGRYLRDYAEGRAQEILRVHEDARFADLGRWRTERGLPPLPDLAVISAGLDFPVPEALTAGGRKVYIVTVRASDPKRCRELAQRGEVILAGGELVNGEEMVRALYERGKRLIYNATGPKVHHMLLAAGLLDRLYLTQTTRALGGTHYATIVDGELLDPPADFRLGELYFDPAGLGGLGQLFATWDIARIP